MTRIYLDHAATTPPLPDVVAAMQPWLSRKFGNPSSLHAEGREARQALDEAREILSGHLSCLFAEVLFTSSGTEAANLAIVGAALANERPERRRLLFGAAEHHCVLHTKPLLERLGYTVELVPVDRVGRLDLNPLESAMKDDVLMLSLMHANNEMGTWQPIREAVDLAHSRGALVHCDAVQTFGDARVGEAMAADLVSLSAHKVYGPKGVGAIYIRAGTKVKPLTVGGGQEREMRAGTENVAGAVGFAEAVRRLAPTPPAARDAFLTCLEAAGFVATVPDRAAVLPGHAHVRLPGVDAETMLIRLDRMGISASSGAACSSGSLEPSHVLLACGYSEREAREGLRFTFGRNTTVELAEEAAARVVEAAEAIRGARVGYSPVADQT